MDVDAKVHGKEIRRGVQDEMEATKSGQLQIKRYSLYKVL